MPLSGVNFTREAIWLLVCGLVFSALALIVQAIVWSCVAVRP